MFNLFKYSIKTPHLKLTSCGILPLKYLIYSQKINQKLLQNAHLNKNYGKVLFIGKDNSIYDSLESFDQIKFNEKILNNVFNINQTPPKLDPIIPYVSGIYQGSPKFYEHTNMPHMYAHIIHKIIHALFGYPKITNLLDLLLRIENIFKNDIIIVSDHNEFFYPLVQDILVQIFARFPSIPYNFLELLTENLIDFSSYKNTPIKMNTVVETVVERHTILPVKKLYKDLVNIKAQNSDNVLDNTYDELSKISQLQNKQFIMDLFVRIKFSIETYNNKKFGLDVKLTANPVKQLSLTHGLLSLSTFIDSRKFVGRFNSDILTSATQKKATMIEIDIIKEYNITFSNLLKKKITNQALWDQFEIIRNQLFMERKVNVVIPSIIATLSNNEEYDIYITNNIDDYNYIISFIKENIIRNNLKTFVPNTGQNAHVDFWHDIIAKIIANEPNQE